MTKKNYTNEKETYTPLTIFSIRPAYTVVLISSLMLLLLFSFVPFNFDLLNIKEIDASPSYTTVTYYQDKSDAWRNDVNKNPFDDCVSGGTSGCN